jgi:hypothetical protein
MCLRREERAREKRAPPEKEMVTDKAYNLWLSIKQTIGRLCEGKCTSAVSSALLAVA